MKIYILLLLIVVSCNNNNKINLDKKSADENLSIQIAEKKFNEVYGVSTIDNEKPLTAQKINDSIWSVSGTMPKSKNGEIILGGTAFGKVDVKNKKVIEYSHGK